MKFSEKFKPAVSKRALLFIAGSFWLIGGGMMIGRALIKLIEIDHLLSFELISGFVLGVCFYLFLFTKISKKHITRISLIKADYPCFFSFFNFRSYVLMIFMISAGVALRQSRIIDPEYLFTFYLIMGVPLVLSAIRFFVAGIKNTIEV